MSSVNREPEQAEDLPPPPAAGAAAATIAAAAADPLRGEATRDNNESSGHIFIESSANSSDSETSVAESNVVGGDDDDDDAGGRRQQPPQLVLKMLNFCKEITVMVFVALAYAALTTESPPKVSKSPSAYPFFSANSPVTDWYRGQITKAIEQARSSDIAFVMFYAPWDAESQTARKEFELTAEYMHKWVTFAAINCWQPGSECKSQYSKVYKWPVLIAYPTHGRGIQYNGPLNAPHMIKFLQNMCRPLEMPTNVNDLISKHDAVIVGNLNVLPGSFEYAVFYLTALRFLEKDPFKDIQFAVVPKPDGDPRIHLYLWNETIVYGGEWHPENVLTWIYKRLHQISGWISPTGSKSLSLSSYIQPGPALIVFTPKNPFVQQIDHYSLLKEVAYEYYNCANNDVISLKQRLIHMERLRNYVNHRELRRKCQLFYQQKQKSDAAAQESVIQSIVTHVPKIWANTSVKPSCGDGCAPCNECFDFGDTLERMCNFGKVRHNRSGSHGGPKTSMLTNRNDPRSPENLRRAAEEDECRNFIIAQKYQPAMFVERSNETGEDLKGLACKNNRSLALIAMDSIQYFHFAEKLGINLSEVKDKTAVVIINEKMETHYTMSGKLTSVNLRSFIKNFTGGSLRRALHPNPQIRSKNTHTYSDLSCKREMGQKEVCVRELNTEDFLDAIMQPNKAVLVFYYSKQCSFCNGIAYTFLTTAKMLSHVGNINFVRIDGDLNLLPWEFTMESYPTILFVPANRKSESRVFPKNIPVTVPNLLAFTLTNLDSGLKLQAMWSICNQTKFDAEKEKCMTSVRAETLSVIDSVLKEWRNASTRQRAKVLHKLQLLRHLHLLFAHSPKEVASIQGYFSRLGPILAPKDEL